MASVLRLCFFFFIHATLGLQPTGHLVIFASVGDSVSLPCRIPSIRSCSLINWNEIGEFRFVTQVVNAGMVTDSKHRRISLTKDCFLQIDHLEMDDARNYTCDDGASSSSVSVEILQITENIKDNEEIELHCSLNNFQGHVPFCKHSGIHIKWLSEANTQLDGNRFHIENKTSCFSKLKITQKLTDHHRKWKCQLTQEKTVKTTTSYTTTVKGGVQEVFAVVGESVSFPCGDTSSLAGGSRVQWSDDITASKDQLQTFHVNQDSSLVISSVSALHSGHYQCSLPNSQEVINRVRLHTLDVSAEYGPEGGNLTLICLLTCVTKCEQDFGLIWSGDSQQKALNTDENTLISKLFLSDLETRRDVTCSVSREGAVMSAKKWPSIKSMQAVAWLALPLGLLLCTVAGGLYVYLKRKHKQYGGHELENVGMTHVYEDVQDINHDEFLQQSQPRRVDEKRREATSINDSFYDLLQAVN